MTTENMNTNNDQNTDQIKQQTATYTNVSYNAKDLTEKELNTNTQKMFKHVVSNIYANKETFLRELIANANDACAKAAIKLLNSPDYQPRIDVLLNKEQKTITITDNGIGMSRQDLEEYIGTLANSNTDKFKQENKNTKTNMIGQFGVGFYSVFMVSDNVTVLTKKDKEEGAQWTSKGDGKYTLATIDKQDIGTQIIINLKEDEFLEPLRIKNVISKYFENHITPIYFNEVKEDNKVTEPTKMNKEFSLLKTPKDQITNEQYNTFYSSTFFDYVPPIKIINVTKELPTTTLKVILFIPANQPFDINSEKTGGNIKLYVNDTFINSSSEIAFTNRSFRWIKGIISCDNIALNMSRENMQNNDHNTKIIRQTIDKIIVNEIIKMKNEENEKYQQIAKTFTTILKEGLCEPNYEQKLMNIISFNFLNLATNEITSETLEKYTQTELQNQKHKENIYYLLAPAANVKELQTENAHHINRFKSIDGMKDKKIILLHDSVDFFWTKFITEYSGHKFTSINTAEASKNKEDEKEETVSKEKSDSLVEFIKKELKEHVDKVTINNYLTYPIQLQGSAATDNIMNKITGNKQHIKNNIEINMKHSVIKKLMEDKDEKALLIAYNIALIADGQPLINRSVVADEILKNMNK